MREDNAENTDFVKKKFDETFDKKLDCSLLIASKRVFNTPDLMLYEFSNSGKVFYGKIKKVSIEKISDFEGFRNILYREREFLKSLTVKDGRISY